MIGFVVTGAGCCGPGCCCTPAGPAASGCTSRSRCPAAAWPAAFGALMGRVLSRVPVAIAADASGVIVTVNQLGIVVGIATFGSLYLNLAGKLPAATARAS